MNYWLTTQWPPFKDENENHPLGVWLRDDKKSVGDSFSSGDLFLVYQTGRGDPEVKFLPDGSKKLLKRQKGKQGIVAIFQIKAGRPVPHNIHYEDGPIAGWWRWPVDVLPKDGFIPRAEVNRTLGYKWNYSPQGIGKGSGIIRISHEKFERLAELLRHAKVVLKTVETPRQVRESVRAFMDESSGSQARALNLVRQTQYWVYDVEEGMFGPGKFVGYSEMDFGKYERAVKDQATGARFDGAVTRMAIEGALGERFINAPDLGKELRRWGEGIFGPGTFDGIDHSKWKFIVLPVTRRYWAALANPAVYRIDEAINEFDETVWTVKRSGVRKGDRLAIWRAKGSSSKRGIISFAEVLSDPAEMEEISEERGYWINPPDSPLQRRVRIRFVKPPGVPLWLEDDSTGLLASLNVARATGGGIFKVKPDQWRKLIEMAGGWTSERETDLEDEIAEAVQRVRAKTGGQGFPLSPKVRSAVEKWAMKRAQEHFEGKGYTVTIKGKPYDLHCSRENETIYVEVKGTQEAGSTIFLTRNEVRFAQDHAPHVALFIVHGIVVIGDAANPEASGGVVKIHKPWNIKEGELSPITYEYAVPNGVIV